MLRACYAIRLFDNDLSLAETFSNIAVANAEAVTNIRALLRTHAKVRGVIVRDWMALVDEWRILSNSLQGIEDARQLFVLYIDQVERLLSFAHGWRGNGCDWITSEAHTLCREHCLILDLAAILPKFSHIVWSEHDNMIW
jgi:hypothetical protein